MSKSPTRVAAVTGGNKGIGLACVRQLALQYPTSAFNNGSLLIYLAARNKERGEKAVADILEDSQLVKAKALQNYGGLSIVKYLPLDIDDNSSIESFAKHLKQEHPDGIDILINNAGVALDGFNLDVVKQTIHSNYYGTKQVTEQILPQMKSGGRLVNVASLSGVINSSYDQSIRKRFLEAGHVDEITRLMEEFTDAVSKNNYKGTWPEGAYRVSKAGEIGMTKCIAEEHQKNGGTVLINSCHPGYVNTDMTKGKGTISTDEGAQTPVLLALGDIGGVTGCYWSDQKLSSWER